MDNMLSEKVQVTETAREYVYSDKHVISLEWNGREIRNGNHSRSYAFSYSFDNFGFDLSSSSPPIHLFRNLLIPSYSPPDRYVPRRV